MKIILTHKIRTQMARNLASFLVSEGIEIKHTTAVRAIAAVFGFNEHSIKKAEIELEIELETP
jgi:hypothetical protein